MVKEITIEEKLNEIKSSLFSWEGLSSDPHNIYIPGILGDEGYREFVNGLFESLRYKRYILQNNHGYHHKASDFIKDSLEKIPCFSKRYGNNKILIMPNPFLEDEKSRTYYIEMHYPFHSVDANERENGVKQFFWGELISKTIIDIEDYLMSNKIPHCALFYLKDGSEQKATFLNPKNLRKILWDEWFNE